ncbi:MAG: hypothetical protein NDI82_06545 [Anaeromyxobacteraceae bacterium]|nr:hypothetical protein [Anaeromyxobacteraceae bacterium]
MSPRTIALASLLALGLGVGLVGHATWRLGALERDSAGLAEASRQAGDSFVETLQGEHAARQFRAFDDRRAVALARAAARRDRLFGLLLAAGGALGLGAAAAFRRIAREIEEERRHLE